jgi:hypothetical protein
VPLVALTRKSSELFSLEVFAGAERGVELLLLAAEILYIVVLFFIGGIRVSKMYVLYSLLRSRILFGMMSFA